VAPLQEDSERPSALEIAQDDNRIQGDQSAPKPFRLMPADCNGEELFRDLSAHCAFMLGPNCAGTGVLDQSRNGIKPAPQIASAIPSKSAEYTCASFAAPVQPETTLPVASLQAWSRNGFGADWSPLNSVSSWAISMRWAFGRLLARRHIRRSSYLLYGHAPGPIFSAGTIIKSETPASADAFRVFGGRFTSEKGSSLYFRACRPSSPTSWRARKGGALVITQPDAALSAPAEMSAAAPPSGPSAMA